MPPRPLRLKVLRKAIGAGAHNRHAIILLMPQLRRSVCALDCPDCCSLVLTVENEKATKLRGDPDHPVTRGFLCGKVARYLEREYSPGRLLHPLRRVGAKAEEQLDGLTVWPADKGQLHGADIETYTDHRMAMCFAVLGLQVPGIRIKNPGCASKTFPNFFEKLEQLRK